MNKTKERKKKDRKKNTTATLRPRFGQKVEIYNQWQYDFQRKISSINVCKSAWKTINEMMSWELKWAVQRSYEAQLNRFFFKTDKETWKKREEESRRKNVDRVDWKNTRWRTIDHELVVEQQWKDILFCLHVVLNVIITVIIRMLTKPTKIYQNVVKRGVVKQNESEYRTNIDSNP